MNYSTVFRVHQGSTQDWAGHRDAAVLSLVPWRCAQLGLHVVGDPAVEFRRDEVDANGWVPMVVSVAVALEFLPIATRVTGSRKTLGGSPVSDETNPEEET